MTRWTTTLTLTAVLALIALAFVARPAAAQSAAPGACPAISNPNLSPWARVGVSDPEDRLADRNTDGLVCRARLRLASGAVWTVLTDNTIGDPSIIPAGTCASPFATVGFVNQGGRGDPSTAVGAIVDWL